MHNATAHRRDNGRLHAGSSRGPQPLIEFTGDRHGKRIVVHINGKAMALTGKCFIALVKLIIARADSKLGYIGLEPAAVSKLRHALDLAGGKGSGLALIETGSGSEYRLRIAAAELRRHIIIRRAFAELVHLKLITEAMIAALQKTFHFNGLR